MKPGGGTAILVSINDSRDTSCCRIGIFLRKTSSELRIINGNAPSVGNLGNKNDDIWKTSFTLQSDFVSAWAATAKCHSPRGLNH